MKLRDILNESVNEAVSKTLKYRSRIGGDIFIEIEEDPAGIFVDVRMKGKNYNALLSTTDIEYPSGHIKVTPRVKNIPIKESVGESVNEAKPKTKEEIESAINSIKNYMRGNKYNDVVQKEMLPIIKKLEKQLKTLKESEGESVNEGPSTEEKRIAMLAVRKQAKYRNVSLEMAIQDQINALEELKRDIKKGKIKK